LTGYRSREAIKFALDLDRFLALEPNHSSFFVARGGNCHACVALLMRNSRYRSDFCHIRGDSAVIRQRQFVDNGSLSYAGTVTLRYTS